MFIFSDFGMNGSSNNIDVNKFSDEMIANQILNTSGINYNDGPIDIEKILQNAGFTIGIIREFANKDLLLEIAHTNKLVKSLNNKKVVIFKRDLQLQDRRYLFALAYADYVLNSNGNLFDKAFSPDDLDINNEEKLFSKEARVARAILIPQKSLSTFLMSPMFSNSGKQEKIDYVSKTFLVGTEIARIRMAETGF